MGMVVRTNMAALNANNSLANASKAQQSGMQKLASGFKINKAADDASGLAISEKMKNQIKALDTAKDNCEDGANLIQTAEGYMKETHDMLTRMTELAEKAANGTLGDEDRSSLQKEMDQLCAEIDRVASTANFNGHKLLDGSLGSKNQVTLTSDPVNGTKYTAPSGTATTSSHLEGNANPDDISGSSYSDAQKLSLAQQANAEAVAVATRDGITSGDVNIYVHKTNGTVTSEDKSTDTANYDQLVISITQQNTTVDAGKGINLQIGESSTSADRLEVSINSFHTDSLLGGINNFINRSNDGDNVASTAKAVTKSNDAANNGVSTYNNAISIDITDQNSASAAADAIRQISNYVSDERGKLGAQQNRLEHTVNNLTTASENTTASKSRILDTDMAKEMMEYTSKNVIAQAAQSMLAQANSQPQNVLSLLQ